MGAINTIDDTTVKQVLFEYSMEKYGGKMKGFYDLFLGEFPDNYEDLSGELIFESTLP